MGSLVSSCGQESIVGSMVTKPIYFMTCPSTRPWTPISRLVSLKFHVWNSVARVPYDTDAVPLIYFTAVTAVPSLEAWIESIAPFNLSPLQVPD